MRDCFRVAVDAGNLPNLIQAKEIPAFGGFSWKSTRALDEPISSLPLKRFASSWTKDPDDHQ